MPICLLTSYLRHKDYETDMLDAFLEDLSIEETVDRVADYDLIGITVHSNVNLVDVKNVIDKIKEKGKKGQKIVLGGHYPSYFPEKTLREIGGDFVVRGEGEETMYRLVDCLAKNGDLSEVKGITFKHNEDVVTTEPAEKIKDLDTVPFMARDNIDRELSLKFVPALSSSRGCAYSDCGFCDIASFQKTSKGPFWRARSAKNVVDEIEYITRKWNFKKFDFVDPNFVGGKQGKKRAEEFADELIKRKLDVRYMFDTRVDEIEESLFRKLYESGLRMVYLGIESCVQRQLDYYKKNATPDLNNKAIEILRKIGITPLFGIIVFEPTTSLDEIRKNFNYFVGQGGFNIYRFVRGIIPRFGTPMMEKFNVDGILIEHYPDYRYKFNHQEVELLFNKSDEYAQKVFLLEKKYKKIILQMISENKIRLDDEDSRSKLITLENSLKEKTTEHFNKILKAFEENKSVSSEEIDKLIDKLSGELENVFSSVLKNV